MEITGNAFIGSERVQGTGPAFRALNPATNTPLEPAFSSSSAADLERAASLAARAAIPYSQLPPSKRAGFLRAIAAGLEAQVLALAERAGLETALPAARLQGEVGRTCYQLRFYAQALEEGLYADARIDHADASRKPLPKPDVRSCLMPLGPVAVFGSSNFPFAYSVAGGDTASALAAGCPVVVKAHPAHPGTSELTAGIIVQAARNTDMPEGVFSLLFDAGYEIGSALVRHPAIKAVGFTGSLRGGRALMDLAAARPEPIPVYAEMGSVNPVFILPAALVARGSEIATGLHASFTMGVGQFCTNPGLVILPAGPAADAFAQKLGELAAATPSGPMLTPGICAAYQAGLARLAGQPKVRRLAGATMQSEQHGAAAVFATDASTFLANRELSLEVFGPSTLLVLCRDVAEVAAVAAHIEGQLTASIHSDEADGAAAAALLSLLAPRVGRIAWNGFPTGVEVCHAMVHGGPYPSSSDGRTTSVGTRAALRFLRPVCFQNTPDAMLPAELQETNPLKIRRLVDGVATAS